MNKNIENSKKTQLFNSQNGEKSQHTDQNAPIEPNSGIKTFPKTHFKKHKHWSKCKMPQKYSLGIACVKLEKNSHRTDYKILMINKRHTYAFSDFVNGKYPADFTKNPQSKQHIMKMLNSMTVAEKLDIISMNFEILWYRLWSNCFHKSHSYIHAKAAFENAFGSPDKTNKLKKMVSKSTHAQIVWEVPKGRKKNKSESDVNCAMREFWEETGVPKSDYKVIPGVRKSYSFIDEGVQYNYTYFIAICKNDVNPTINFDSPEQINEVSDIKWLNMEGVKFVDSDGKLEPFVRGVFKTVSSHLKAI